MRIEFQEHFSKLETEMIKNQEMQEQMLKMQQSMMEMQQTVIDMQQQALDRMVAIQGKVQAILIQNYELHEYPIPRLFIVLPKDSSRWDPVNLFQNKFQLYFLCECGEHTKGQNSNIPHHIHLARHEGYDLESPTEFFRRYGPYVLRLLQMLKYGVTVAGFVVPALVPLQVADRVDRIKNSFDNYSHNIELGLHQSLGYLQNLSAKESSSASTGYEDKDDEQGRRMDELEALEGADLRRLETFLSRKDANRVLGNLYRVVTSDGHVKWVCLDHYRETYNAVVIKELSEVIGINGGVFDEALGQVEIRLLSATAASQFYKALGRSKFVCELKVVLTWEVSVGDLKLLRDAILKSNIACLDLTCTASSVTTDIFNRHKRSNPLWQIIMNTKLQTFTLNGFTGFFSHSNILAKTNDLRVLKISEHVDWKKDGAKLVQLLERSPKLQELCLGVTEIDEVYAFIKNLNCGYCSLESLALDAGRSQGMQVQFESGVPVSMDLLVSGLSSPHLNDTRILRTLHIRRDYQVPFKIDIQLFRSIISRNPDLTRLTMQCSDANFQQLHNAIRGSIEASSPCKLRVLTLYGGGNRLSMADLRDESSVELGLMSDSISRAVLDVYGSNLTKLRINSSGALKAVASMLAGRGEKGRGISLKNVEIPISRVTEDMFQDLRLVLKSCASTLTNLVIFVDREWDSGKSNYLWSNNALGSSLVDFIVEFGSCWTSISMNKDVAETWTKALKQRGFTVPDEILM
ncbi:hypothetical protein BGZ58_003065, partial [Dissophora ornata]